MSHELLHGRPDARRAVGLNDICHLDPRPRRVRLQDRGRRLVRDEGTNLLWMARRELEADGGAATAGEYKRRFLRHRRQQPVRVIGEDLHDPGVIEGALEGAVREAPGVVGDDRVMRRQRPGDVPEGSGVGWSARHHQQRGAGAANLVVDARSRHVQRRGLHRYSRLHGTSYRSIYLLRLPFDARVIYDATREASRFSDGTKNRLPVTARLKSSNRS